VYFVVFSSGEVEDVVLVGNDAGVQDNWIPTFRSRVLLLPRHVDHLKINPLTPELNPSAQRCLPIFLLWILIVKELTARRLYKSFGVKGLIYYVLSKRRNRVAPNAEVVSQKNGFFRLI
jgi:hypothetical protein